MANREESDKEEDLDEEDMQNLHIDGKYQMRKLNYIFQTIINFCITFFNRWWKICRRRRIGDWNGNPKTYFSPHYKAHTSYLIRNRIPRRLKKINKPENITRTIMYTLLNNHLKDLL